MWVLIECEDPVNDPGHSEIRRILIDPQELVLGQITTDITISAIGTEIHPHTPGDGGYHCPACHKDISDGSDGDNTFPFVDDFPGSSLDTSKWDLPACHKDIPGNNTGRLQGMEASEIILDEGCHWAAGQNEEDIIKAVQELRKEFEYMAVRKIFDIKRNKIGEYVSGDTFCFWAGYWERAIQDGAIPDKIEYINTD